MLSSTEPTKTSIQLLPIRRSLAAFNADTFFSGNQLATDLIMMIAFLNLSCLCS